MVHTKALLTCLMTSPFAVGGTTTVATLKALIEGEMGFATARHDLFFAGRPLGDSSTLSAGGVGNDDMLEVRPKGSVAGAFSLV
jgi:hypothetical protein